MASRRSRASAGSRQGRNAVHGARFKAAIRRKRGEEQARDRVHTLGDERRSDVYRTDAGFAPEEKPNRHLPPRGPERDALAQLIAEAKAAGESHLKLGERLGFDTAQIAYVCKQYGISRTGDRR